MLKGDLCGGGGGYLKYNRRVNKSEKREGVGPKANILF